MRHVQAFQFPRSWRGGLLVTSIIAALVGGCGPSKEQIRLARAMSGGRCEVCPDCRDALVILEKYRNDDRHKDEYVQYGMCQTTAAVLGGNILDADRVAKETTEAVAKYHDATTETLAALGNEGVKFFKGKPHERALLDYYAGLACYLRGEYNNARIFFAQSLHATATRDDDMKQFRDDFQLGHFWLGRAYLKLGSQDNARVAFKKAGVVVPHQGQERELEQMKAQRAKAYKAELQAEAASYKQYGTGEEAVPGALDLSKPLTRNQAPEQLPGASQTDPIQRRAANFEDFLSPEFQQEANLIIVVEMGVGPVKVPSQVSSSFDDIKAVSYREKGVDVYVDGHLGGPGFRLLDTYHQAVTRGVQTRRGRQLTKTIAKEVLKRTPFVGTFAGLWNINADFRFWPSLPGEYHVYAARVSPGVHDLHFKFYDVNDNYLPRYDVTRHFISVPEKGERVMVIHALENKDNAYVLTQNISKK